MHSSTDLSEDFFESSSNASSDSSDDINWTRQIGCPVTNCRQPAFERELIDHLRQRHNIRQLQIQSNYFKSRICYRRRVGGYGLLPAGFSDSDTANCWIAGIMTFDEKQFLLHIMEKNGLMHMWVSVDDDRKTINEYVANIALYLPGGRFPAYQIRQLWRGIVVSVFKLDNCAKFIVPNNILWRDFTFQVATRPRQASQAAGTQPHQSKQQQRPLTNYHWNMRIILEKSPTLSSTLEDKGGGEMVFDKSIWFNATNTKVSPPPAKTVPPTNAGTEFKTPEIETSRHQQKTEINPPILIDWDSNPTSILDLIDSCDEMSNISILSSIQNEVLRKLNSQEALSYEELREVEDALFLLQLADRQESTTN